MSLKPQILKSMRHIEDMASKAKQQLKSISGNKRPFRLQLNNLNKQFNNVANAKVGGAAKMVDDPKNQKVLLKILKDIDKKFATYLKNLHDIGVKKKKRVKEEAAAEKEAERQEHIKKVQKKLLPNERRYGYNPDKYEKAFKTSNYAKKDPLDALLERPTVPKFKRRDKEDIALEKRLDALNKKGGKGRKGKKVKETIADFKARKKREGLPCANCEEDIEEQKEELNEALKRGKKGAEKMKKENPMKYTMMRQLASNPEGFEYTGKELSKAAKEFDYVMHLRDKVINKFQKMFESQTTHIDESEYANVIKKLEYEESLYNKFQDKMIDLEKNNKKPELPAITVLLNKSPKKYNELMKEHDKVKAAVEDLASSVLGKRHEQPMKESEEGEGFGYGGRFGNHPDPDYKYARDRYEMQADLFHPDYNRLPKGYKEYNQLPPQQFGDYREVYKILGYL